MITKKLLLVTSVVFIAQASQTWTDMGISWTKAAASSFVAGCSAHRGLELFTEKAWADTDFSSFMKSIGYAYAVSKIAPYARRNFNLEPATLLESNHTIHKDRKRAFLEAVTRGCVAVPCCLETYQLATEKFKISNTNIINLVTVGQLCGMGYTLYQALPYVYKHARMALAV